MYFYSRSEQGVKSRKEILDFIPVCVFMISLWQCAKLRCGFSLTVILFLSLVTLQRYPPASIGRSNQLSITIQVQGSHILTVTIIQATQSHQIAHSLMSQSNHLRQTFVRPLPTTTFTVQQASNAPPRQPESALHWFGRTSAQVHSAQSSGPSGDTRPDWRVRLECVSIVPRIVDCIGVVFAWLGT